MHFASLILAITAATTASASAVAKRGGFYPTFAYSDAAINAPVGDYLTYTLVSDIFECFTACDGVADCKFVNTYYDVNASSKDCSPLLTCSMFNACFADNYATNKGGQKSTCAAGNNFIEDSWGWCKY